MIEGGRGADLEATARAVLEQHWVAEGYAAPNGSVYPWQWLWDSCFHSLIWLALGDDRAAVELTSVFTHQAPDGFVPHMSYRRDPSASVEFWGRRGSSSITQPPMYGHVVAEMHRRGLPVADETIEAATAGLRFLVDVRRREPASGLIQLCHPWESGADDDPRWDDACPGGRTPEAWYRRKGELVGLIEPTSDGSPVANPGFAVASVGFNALVAFNATELASVTGDDHLGGAASVLVDAIDDRWESERGVWGDAGTTSGGSGSARTAYGALPLLVSRQSEALSRVPEALTRPDEFGSPFGPRGVHPTEPSYEPDTYWRGPVWPQLAYLHWLALVRLEAPQAAELVDRTVDGAVGSGFAEYWSPVDGRGLGAIPQSWTGLTLLMRRGRAGD